MSEEGLLLELEIILRRRSTMESIQEAKCRKLVLDAGPLLSLSPLRGLAETFFTVPQVLAELKDRRAREHFEKLGLLSGVKIEVRSPNAVSLNHVIQRAKLTGDYSVLSHVDLCVLALTYALDQEDKQEREKEREIKDPQVKMTTTEEKSQPLTETVEAPPSKEQSATVTVDDLTDELGESILDDPTHQPGPEIVVEQVVEDATLPKVTEETEERPLEALDVVLEPVKDATPSEAPVPAQALTSAQHSSTTPVYDDPSDDDDGEGDWITPSNVSIYKSQAMDLLPDDGLKDGKRPVQLGSGCMTADFAMQNVLLQMGLNLVGLEGKRIEKIKTWVLRCHACFKICKDNSKKFCPSCGNPTLLRASVTVAAPGASPNAQPMQVHLKPNFQYKLRGTKYSIPAPKAGTAKGGPGQGLILREDQIEYMRAKKQADGKREREEQKLLKGILSRDLDGKSDGRGFGSWLDPDWMPEMMSVGSGGKGRTMKSSRMDGDMPQIGHGRKNPNEKRRKK